MKKESVIIAVLSLLLVLAGVAIVELCAQNMTYKTRMVDWFAAYTFCELGYPEMNETTCINTCKGQTETEWWSEKEGLKEGGKE